LVKITEIPRNAPPHFFKPPSTLYEYSNAEKEGMKKIKNEKGVKMKLKQG